jgi:hypothetical protein
VRRQHKRERGGRRDPVVGIETFSLRERLKTARRAEGGRHDSEPAAAVYPLMIVWVRIAKDDVVKQLDDAGVSGTDVMQIVTGWFNHEGGITVEIETEDGR